MTNFDNLPTIPDDWQPPAAAPLPDPSTKPMFPHVIDSTMLSAFRSCPQKMFRSYVEHWKPKNESVHLVAGGAFASGIEAAREAYFLHGKTHRDDYTQVGIERLIQKYGHFEPPETGSGSAKTCERMVGALEFYFEHYPLGEDGLEPLQFPNGKFAIEFGFAEPLPISHPESGQPLLFAGRADMLGSFAGSRYSVDEKTTSSLGASWARQWEMRSQFTAYNWAARQAGIALDGTIVRGISILKTKYETLEVLTYRPDWEIDRWLQQTCADIRRMIACWATGYWDWSLDGACTEYGGCSFQQVCKSQDPMTWLPMSFDRRVWDPLGRQEISIADWEAGWRGPVA
ncbi:MAG: PD-(D/E)XK nuclease family protein [Methylobacterium sp.]|nr:PD-(D/E)XK nuclease family protein [Methylobacterium sp.]